MVLELGRAIFRRIGRIGVWASNMKSRWFVMMIVKEPSVGCFQWSSFFYWSVPLNPDF